jgi:hypothetical protein
MNIDQKIDVVSTSGCCTVQKNPNAVALGALGGAAGRGESKRRTREHYQKASAARWEKHRKQKGK